MKHKNFLIRKFLADYCEFDYTPMAPTNGRELHAPLAAHTLLAKIAPMKSGLLSVATILFWSQTHLCVRIAEFLGKRRLDSHMVHACKAWFTNLACIALWPEVWQWHQFTTAGCVSPIVLCAQFVCAFVFSLCRLHINACKIYKFLSELVSCQTNCMTSAHIHAKEAQLVLLCFRMVLSTRAGRYTGM